MDDHQPVLAQLIELGLIRPADPANMQVRGSTRRPKTLQVHPEIDDWLAGATPFASHAISCNDDQSAEDDWLWNQ